MNRLQPQAWQGVEPETDGPASTVASAVYSERDDICCHSLFSPLHYESNYAYPLIVWLHGPHVDERQLKRVMPLLSMRNYAAIAPRATLALDAEDDHAGFRWRQQSDHIYLAEQRVFECIELAQRKLHIHSRRVFLAGAGCGGTMALRLALAYPERFAGVVSLGGALPRGLAPLARVNEARGMPLLLMAGLESARYPQSRVCEDLRLLHSAGFNVSLRLYPMADDLDPMMLSDVDRWMMQQICPSGD